MTCISLLQQDDISVAPLTPHISVLYDRMMRKLGKIIGLLFVVFSIGLILFLANISRPQSVPIISTVIDDRPLATLSEDSSVNSPLAFKNPVTILLLGLDNRRGQKSSRCDAIHLLSYNIKEETLVIINIPRGTPYKVPGYDEQFSVISNACSVLGVDAVAGGIEKLTNTPIDYVVTAGFSGVSGIVRNLKLPAAETLMSLRSRAYGVGDNQRSYNQAVFLKDMLTLHLKEFSSFPKPFRYLMYSFVESTLDFESADSLLTVMSKSKISTDESRITIHTFSPFTIPVKDIHILESLTTIKEENTKEKDYTTYQQTTITYLRNLIKSSSNLAKDGRKDQAFKTIELPFSQKIWLQVDDEKTRNSLYFDLLSIYVTTSGDISKSREQIFNFINEMDIAGDIDLKQKAESLLSNL